MSKRFNSNWGIREKIRFCLSLIEEGTIHEITDCWHCLEPSLTRRKIHKKVSCNLGGLVEEKTVLSKGKIRKRVYKIAPKVKTLKISSVR